MAASVLLLVGGGGGNEQQHLSIQLRLERKATRDNGDKRGPKLWPVEL
jgi:hypothetical protein